MKRKERLVILVAGATGRLGGLIALRLLAQGAAVRVLVRHNSPAEELARQGRATSARSLIEAGAQRAYGDLKDRASLDAACQGIRTLITTANSAARGGDDNPQTVDLEGNRDLIDAARAAGVKQFVFVSAYVADPDSLVPFLAAKGKTEVYLHDSGMAYTILAPNAFMESWVANLVGRAALAGRPVTLVGTGERVHSFIATADVASFAVAAVGNPAALNRRLVLGGPEALSFRDAVGVYERVLGRTPAGVRMGDGSRFRHVRLADRDDRDRAHVWRGVDAVGGGGARDVKASLLSDLGRRFSLIYADFSRLICGNLRRKAPRSEVERVLCLNQSSGQVLQAAVRR
jgi:NADH dehydrogenase